MLCTIGWRRRGAHFGFQSVGNRRAGTPATLWCLMQTRLTTQVEDSGAPVRCQLVVVEGPELGRAVALDVPRTVGTASGNDLMLSDDRVSGQHLRLEREGTGFRVKDLESTNGTWLEGARITEVTLRPGATLKVGRTFLRVQQIGRAHV